MIFFAIIVVLATILTALVAGNNMSAAVGTLIGSRILSRTGGVIIGMLGFIAGLLIQGHNLSSTAVQLIPRENTIIAYSLGIALGIFLLAAYLRVPLSLTMALVGISIGISERNGFPLDTGLISIIIFTWVLAPVLSIFSAYLLNKKLSGMRPGNVWNFALSLEVSSHCCFIPNCLYTCGPTHWAS
jgi:Phosphate/sulphate permeases